MLISRSLCMAMSDGDNADNDNDYDTTNKNICFAMLFRTTTFGWCPRKYARWWIYNKLSFVNANDLWHNPCDSEPKNKKKTLSCAYQGTNKMSMNGMEWKKKQLSFTEQILLRFKFASVTIQSHFKILIQRNERTQRVKCHHPHSLAIYRCTSLISPPNKVWKGIYSHLIIADLS